MVEVGTILRTHSENHVEPLSKELLLIPQQGRLVHINLRDGYLCLSLFLEVACEDFHGIQSPFVRKTRFDTPHSQN